MIIRIGKSFVQIRFTLQIGIFRLAFRMAKINMPLANFIENSGFKRGPASREK